MTDVAVAVDSLDRVGCPRVLIGFICRCNFNAYCCRYCCLSSFMWCKRGMNTDNTTINTTPTAPPTTMAAMIPGANSLMVSRDLLGI